VTGPVASGEHEVELTRQLTRIIEQIREFMDAERATLYLHDRETDELRSRVLLADGIGEIRLKQGEGIAGSVLATGEPVRIDDVAADPRFLGRFDQASGFVTRSMLCQPLINAEDQRIGVVQVINKRGGPFTERDERLLWALDSQAAIAIENSQLVHALRASQAKEAALLAERERQASELRIAQSIQNGLLPKSLPENPRFRAHAMIEPAREVGGDLYDLFFLDDNRLALAIGDVSGKGVPAALFMAVTRTLMRALAFQIEAPAELLAELNKRLSEDNPSNMFVTLFFGVLDLRTGALIYASGGHNPPLLLSADNRAGMLPRVRGVALGVFAGAPYDEGAATLDAGEHVLLYTDGLTEAMNSGDELYGDDRAVATAARLARFDPRQLIEALRRDVAEHVAGAEPSDDLTLLDVRYTPVTSA
jgi:sigma-B regulation protein RsbU (phosphoserine phosphatase)